MLAGCAYFPHGEFYGKNTLPSNPYSHDLVVVWVDGQLVFNTSGEPTVVGANVAQVLKPGHHYLLVRVLKSGEQPLMPLELTIRSCIRYNFVAKELSGGLAVVAEGETPIRGCKH